METKSLEQLILKVLEEFKAQDICVLDIRKLSNIADEMILATGNSTRHVQSIATELVQKTKQAQHPALGVEGEQDGEWILIDLNSVIVHIMLPQTRDYYQIEKLWSMGDEDEAAS